ncbi:MAG: hypothetical protein GY788_18400, partial [bacterium]|nr:hypothetical protein [bacterium]
YFSVLAGTVSSGFTLTMKDDTVYTFNTDGALTLITDANGHTITLAYDGNDELDTVSSSASTRTLSFTWNDGFISEVATDPVTPAGGGTATPLVTKYYYTDDQLVESCDPRDNTQTTGVCHVYSYTNRRITQITKPEGNIDARIGYYPSGEVQWRQDGEGFAGGYQTSFVKPQPDRVEITDGRGNTSTQVFDDKYRLVEEHQTVDTVNYTTTYTYDDDGNRETVTDANDNTATMGYDDRGNMTSVKNAEDETSWFQYDLDDNLIATRDGRSASSSDDTYKTAFTYDSVGNKESETDPLGHKQTWGYTDGTEAAYGGGTVPAGLLEAYVEARGNTGPVPDNAYATTYDYYSNGDLAVVTTPSGFETLYTYDELGRLSTEAISDPVAVIDEEVVATYSYDAAGNIKTVTGPSITDALTNESHQLVTTNTYDDNSNLTVVVESDAVGSDPDRTTTMDYDLNDRECKVTDPEDGVLEREYDKVGNVTKVTDQNLTVTETIYDARNLATDVYLRDFDDGHGSVARDIHLSHVEYDKAGRKTSETDAEGRVTEWDYDNADRVLTVTRLDFDDHTTAALRDVVLSANTYDDAGNVETQTTGDGTTNQSVVTNTYDNAGRLNTSTLEMGNSDRVTDFDYDEAGNIRFVTRSQATTTELTESVFDVGGRLTRSVVDPTGDNLITYYDYDARGNQTEMRDARSTGAADNAFLTTTGYDLLSRPVSVVSPSVDVSEYGAAPETASPRQRVGYDTYGNQTTVEDERGQVTTNTYDRLGRLTHVIHPDNLGFGIADGDLSPSSWVVSAESTSKAYRATDGNLGTYWNLGAGVQAATFDLGEITRLETIEFWMYYANGRTYYDVQVETSVDGVVWETVYGPTDTAFNAAGLTIDLDPGTYAKFIRTTSNGNTSNTSNHIVEIRATNGQLDPASWVASGATTTYAFRATDGSLDTYWNLGKGLQTATFDLGESTELETIEFWMYYANGRSYYDVQVETSADGVVWDTVYGPTDTAFNAAGLTIDLDSDSDVRYIRTTSNGSTSNSDNHIVEIDATVCSDCLMALQPVETFRYDPVGNMSSQTSRRGETTIYAFDDLNRVVEQTDPLVTGEATAGTVELFYNDVGEQTAIVDQEEARTEYGYDELGRLIHETVVVSQDPLPNDYSTIFDYDDLGNRTYVKEPSGAETTSLYNAASELTSVTDDNNETATFNYDLAGRKSKATDRAGRITEWDYDSVGQLEEMRQVDADDTTVLSTTGYGFDEVGNLKTVTSPRGFSTTYDYDELSRLESVVVPVNTSQTITTSYGYDEAGNQTLVTDGRNNDFWTVYNAWNLPIEVIEPVTTAHPTLANRRWVTTYDAGGLPVQEEQPGGVTITRSFDELGRLSTETGDGTGVTSGTRSFWYDLAGRVTAVTHPAGYLTYSYDDRGLLLTADDGAGETTQYEYDSNGRMTERIDAAGTHSYTWTMRNELDRVDDPITGLELDYDWTEASEPKKITYDSTGLVRDYDYDNRGLLESDTLTNGATSVAAFGYLYDDDGNVEHKTVTLSGNSMSGTHDYTYDRGGRLTSWDAPGQTVVSYVWDNSGNRTTAGSDTYTYDQRNRLLTGPDGTYTYDPRGTLNQIGTTTYDFDALGRLIDYNN